MQKQSCVRLSRRRHEICIAAPAETMVQVGDPDDAILACARERQADLIVMGTQGLGGFRKAFFGSVTEKVLRGAFVPVLAVKPIGSVPAAIPSGIVAAVHLDETAGSVLQHAAAFAGVFKVPLTLLHVVAAVQALPQYTGRARRGTSRSGGTREGAASGRSREDPHGCATCDRGADGRRCRRDRRAGKGEARRGARDWHGRQPHAATTRFDRVSRAESHLCASPRDPHQRLIDQVPYQSYFTGGLDGAGGPGTGAPRSASCPCRE